MSPPDTPFNNMMARITTLPPRDLHAETAALMFNVPIAEVTPEMRRLGRLSNYRALYEAPFHVSSKSE